MSEVLFFKIVVCVLTMVICVLTDVLRGCHLLEFWVLALATLNPLSLAHVLCLPCWWRSTSRWFCPWTRREMNAVLGVHIIDSHWAHQRLQDTAPLRRLMILIHSTKMTFSLVSWVPCPVQQRNSAVHNHTRLLYVYDFLACLFSELALLVSWLAHFVSSFRNVAPCSVQIGC